MNIYNYTYALNAYFLFTVFGGTLQQQIINDIYLIRQILESFHQHDFHFDSNFFHSSTGFPKCCCADTSKLLGLYLKQQYGKQTVCVSACGLGNNSNQSHTWLVCEGVIIDITADQFVGKGYDVAQVMISPQSDFHTLFDRIDCYALNTDCLEGSPVASVLKKVLHKM